MAYIIPNLLSTEKCEELSNSILTMYENNEHEFDRWCQSTPSFYNPSLGVETQNAILTQVEESLNLSLSVSCCYARLFLSGQVLPRHKDRKAMEYGVSVNISKSADVDWKYMVEEPSGLITLSPSIGDGIVYQGSKFFHYKRDALSCEQNIELDFYFVDANGDFASLAGDADRENSENDSLWSKFN